MVGVLTGHAVVLEVVDVEEAFTIVGAVNNHDDSISIVGVLAFYFVISVGVVVICRAAATGCLGLGRCCLRALVDIWQKHIMQETGVQTNKVVPGIGQHNFNEENESAVSGGGLYYGSDLSGEDARNLIVGLCRIHDCKEDFIRLLLTLLGGIILPPGNALPSSSSLSLLNINVGAKQFYTDCEGQLHLKKRKCLRGRGAALLEDRRVNRVESPPLDMENETWKWQY